jgi:hypothetical protein
MAEPRGLKALLHGMVLASPKDTVAEICHKYVATEGANDFPNLKRIVGVYVAMIRKDIKESDKMEEKVVKMIERERKKACKLSASRCNTLLRLLNKKKMFPSSQIGK